MSQPTIVVGIGHHPAESVIDQALVFAANFHARLLCVSVDVTRYIVSRDDGGKVRASPYDADSSGSVDEVMPSEIVEGIRQRANAAHVECDFLATAGDPTAEISKAAEESSALMIVIGTRKTGLGGTVYQFFAGSVAANLAHRQHRPVVVIPLDPVGMADPLPWGDESHS
jgi:nucleotide-binding universal stress UspA family protein